MKRHFGSLKIRHAGRLLAGLFVSMPLCGAGTMAETANGLGRACGTDGDCDGYFRCQSSICAVPPGVHGRAEERTPIAEFTTGGVSRGRFFIEIASDWPQRMRGLSHRPSMAEGWGMLFIFERDVRNAFTMEQVLFPLDMIFMDVAGTVVDVISDARPKQRRLEPAQRYRYVLELNAGTARARGIGLGDRLTLINLPDPPLAIGSHRPPEP